MNVTITKPLKKNYVVIKKLFTIVISQNFKDYGFYNKYQDDIQYEVGKQLTALEEYFTSGVKITYFLIAKDADKIIGTIAYGNPSSDIEKYYPELPEHIPEIKCLYILPEYQRKGVGTRLLGKIMEVIVQNGFNEFCLDSGYPKAQKFWTKRLGEPVIQVHNRWGAGNDYLVWHFRII